MGRNFLLRLVQFGLMHIWPPLVLLISAAFLPVGETGALAIILSIATLFRPLVGFSLGRAAIRYVGENRARVGEEKAAAFARLAFRLAVPVSLAGGVLLLGVMAGAFGVYDIEGGMRVVLLAAAFAYFLGTTELMDGLLRSEGRFGPLAKAVVVSRFTALAGLFALLAFAPALEAMLAVLASAEALCTFMLVQAFRRYHGSGAGRLAGPEHSGPAGAHARTLLGYCLPVVVNSLAVYLYARSLVLVVGLFEPPAAVAGFELAVQLTTLPMAFTIIVATVISPRAAEMYAGDARRRHALRVLLSKGAAFSLWVNVVCMIALALFGPVLLELLFPQLANAGTILLIVSPLIALRAFAQILSGEVAVALGHAGVTARITLAFGVLNILFGFAGAFLAGAVGAAVAMLAVHGLACLVSVRVLAGRTGLHLRYRWAPVAAGALAARAPAILVMILLSERPLLSLAAGAVLFGLGHAATLWVSWKRRLPFHKPLADGTRMLLPPNPKYSLLPKRRSHRTDDVTLSRSVNAYLTETRPEIARFWRGDCAGAGFDGAAFLAHADHVYSKWLIGEEASLSPRAAECFAEAVAAANLAGRAGPGRRISPHLTAYVLGALNLLAASGLDFRNPVYGGIHIDPSSLIDPDSHLPRWPRLWSHHSWRASHWIGGIPATLLNFARFDPKRQVDEALVRKVMEACDRRLLSEETGLMRTYRSADLQKAFRTLYRLRHSPDLADIGGLVHLHWVNHALGRRYVAAARLLEESTRHVCSRYPFLEGSPYCLDFDLVQLQRTSLEQEPAYDAGKLLARNAILLRDLSSFLSNIPCNYSMHRLPGALAALHEASMIAGRATVAGIGIVPRDIIRSAHWL